MSLINWDNINLLASQEAAASHPRGLQHFFKSINTSPTRLHPVRAQKGKHTWNRSQNGAGAGAGSERPVSLGWGNKGLVGRWTYQKHTKFGKLIGHFEKAPGPSHTPAIIIPGEQRSTCLLMCSLSLSLSLALSLTLSLAQETHTCSIHLHTLSPCPCGPSSHVACGPAIPHAGSRSREPKIDSCWKHTLSWLDAGLDWTLIWSVDSGQWPALWPYWR